MVLPSYHVFGMSVQAIEALEGWGTVAGVHTLAGVLENPKYYYHIRAHAAYALAKVLALKTPIFSSRCTFYHIS